MLENMLYCSHSFTFVAENKFIGDFMKTITYCIKNSVLTEKDLIETSNNAICNIFTARSSSVGYDYYGQKIILANLFKSSSLFCNQLTLYDGDKKFYIHYHYTVLNWGQQKTPVMFVLLQKKSKFEIKNIILASKFFEEIEPQKMINAYFSGKLETKPKASENTENDIFLQFPFFLEINAVKTIYKLNETELKLETTKISASTFTYRI